MKNEGVAGEVAAEEVIRITTFPDLPEAEQEALIGPASFGD
ncbi:MAG: hypothetical protein WC817_03620 [Patescibacteria group bacterium]|jgi:hypothetical protein